MTATPTVPAEVAAYVAEVRAALGDLPAGERDDLLAEVEASILEAAGERGGSIADGLGTPQSFAAELRAAAGLHAPPAATPAPAPAPGRSAREALQELWESERVERARATANELAPLWWAARAYVAVVSLTILARITSSPSHPYLPGRDGTAELVGLTIIAAAVASTWLGFNARGRAPSRLRLAVNVLLVIAIVPVASRVTAASQPVYEQILVEVPPAEASADLNYQGTQVLNLYPYSRDGRLLQDVLLYDNLGRAIEIGRGRPDPDRRFVESRDGTSIFNAFPIRYFEPGTKTVADPAAGPKVTPPRVVTPALGGRP
jgi:hypothetical protein